MVIEPLRPFFVRAIGLLRNDAVAAGAWAGDAIAGGLNAQMIGADQANRVGKRRGVGESKGLLDSVRSGDGE
jgi:hypothetical protein